MEEVAVKKDKSSSKSPKKSESNLKLNRADIIELI